MQGKAWSLHLLVLSPLQVGGSGVPLARPVVGVVQGWTSGDPGQSEPRPLSSRPPQFQGLQLERDACLASNYALAKENLALRPRLEMGRTALAIKYQELREVAENCADKLQRLGEGRPRRPAWGGVGLNSCQVLKGGTGTHLLLDKV
jgi:hypothetical protein